VEKERVFMFAQEALRRLKKHLTIQCHFKKERRRKCERGGARDRKQLREAPSNLDRPKTTPRRETAHFQGRGETRKIVNSEEKSRGEGENPGTIPSREVSLKKRWLGRGAFGTGGKSPLPGKKKKGKKSLNRTLRKRA